MSEEAREKLLENYGIELEGEFDVTLKGKVRFFRKYDIKVPFVERRGIYLGELKKDGIRLNVYTSSRLGRLAKKNVIEIDVETFCRLLRGERVPYEAEPGYYILKLGEDYVGSVRCNGRELIPFFPKEFRSMLKKLCEDRFYVIIGLRRKQYARYGLAYHAPNRYESHPRVFLV